MLTGRVNFEVRDLACLQFRRAQSMGNENEQCLVNTVTYMKQIATSRKAPRKDVFNFKLPTTTVYRELKLPTENFKYVQLLRNFE